MTDSERARRGRLAMRSRRRGILEMDLILGDFAARELPALGAAELDLYDLLLDQSDHDLLLWITGARAAPDALAPLVARIAAGAVGIGERRLDAS
jgi:antitoxin CptB